MVNKTKEIAVLTSINVLANREVLYKLKKQQPEVYANCIEILSLKKEVCNTKEAHKNFLVAMVELTNLFAHSAIESLTNKS